MQDYAELRDRIAREMHRGDLAGRIPEWVDFARQRINRRYGVNLAMFASDTDTNNTLLEHEVLYLYAALAAAYAFTNNGSAARAYDGMWTIEANQVNITASGSEIDQDAGNEMAVLSEAEVAAHGA